MGHNPSSFRKGGAGGNQVQGKDTDDFPVENVSWDDAQDFLKKLNALAAEKKYKVRYRLPTEAEWEYACRGGHKTKDRGKAQLPFHFESPTASLSSKQANFDGNSPYGGADGGDYLARPCKVGSSEANPLGLVDVHGNVWEWCSDWFDGKYYANSPKADPLGPEKGTTRVIRGGGWNSNGRGCRAANRYSYTPDFRAQYVGFRVAAGPSSE
jgi:formylglycine-generating enzyme required for sulfatase activity